VSNGHSNDGLSVRAEWKKGWPVVLSGAVGFGCGSSLFNMAAGLFIKPMQADLGWSIKALTIMPIVVVVMALCNPLIGAVVDRWGARPVVISGLLLSAIGTVGLAVSPTTPIFFYTWAVFLGIVAPFTSSGPITKAVASWFSLSPGTAFGITMSGVSFVALAGIPLISFVIQSFGWRGGYLVFALIAVLVGLPAVLLGFREKKSASSPSSISRSAQPGVHWREALGDMRFWILLMAFFISSLPLGGFLGHLQPILATKQFPIVEATFLGMVFAFSVLIGRVVGGFLLDRFWDGFVAFVLLALPALGAAILIGAGLETPLPIMIAIVLLIGMGQGAEADFVAYFSLRLFGLRSYSTLVGLNAMIVGFGLALGGIGFAAMADAYGDYSLAMGAGSACFFIAAVLFLAVRLIQGKASSM
jgi:MFS family permease